MPTRPPKPCVQPGCGALVANGSRCAAHQREHYRQFNARRGTVTEQGYGTRWRKIRDYHIALEPLCRECLGKGKTVAASEVDHIVPRAQGGTDDDNNLQSLCKSCHSAKTAREVLNKGRGVGGSKSLAPPRR
jgi:5-methylcytosine-specific restriction enzyme A